MGAGAQGRPRCCILSPTPRLPALGLSPGRDPPTPPHLPPQLGAAAAIQFLRLPLAGRRAEKESITVMDRPSRRLVIDGATEDLSREAGCGEQR